MKKALILLLIAIAALSATAGSAGAADRGTFTLTRTSETASWSGELQTAAPVLPQACTPDVCDIVKLNVKLGKHVWARPGGMLVATHPPPDFTNINFFDLYVYGPDGGPVRTQATAEAASFWGIGDHAAWIENPANGVYTIVVAPKTMFEPPARYHGFVSFARGLTVKRQELKEGLPYTQKFVAFGLPRRLRRPVALLPELVPIPPHNFHIASGGVCLTVYLCNNTPRQPSCYPEETAGLTSHEPLIGPGPQRCLRFDEGEDNFGDGPFELHIYPEKGTGVYQRVYRSDGSVVQYPVGDSEFHATHGHFHYTGGGRWWDITLHKWLPNGEPGEVVPQATFPEKGICTLDVVNGRFGQSGDSPSFFGNDDPLPCSVPRQQDPHDPTFPNSPYIQAGISVGWADVYPWFVQDQYIDITNVPDGKYVIVVKEDPGQKLVEKSRANDTAMACVEFSGLTASAC
jgi:hypothetical protein